ncbi:MAG: dihydropteroate synthase [Gemmatimonadota bacterium]
MWKTAAGSLSLEDPLVMGVLNLTPDSFFDGGALATVDDALRRAETMVEAGAGMLDVGGESTRPGASPVPLEEERRRVLPFVREAVRHLDIPLSVDTRKAAVAADALEAGAAVINDVSGLAHDPDMAHIVARAGAGVVLMHMRGEPADMQERTAYADVRADVARALGAAVEHACERGVPREAIVVDPGIGFAKTARQSLALLGDLGPLRALGRPILVGPSRKSFIGHVTGARPEQRLAGTIAACVMAYLEGARIFRVHDVQETVQALQVARAIGEGEEEG